MLSANLRSRVAWALAGLYLIWGSTYYAMRVALETMPPFTMAGVRYVLAGGGLYALLRLGGAAAPTRAEWRSAALLGLLLLAGGNGLIAVGQQWASSSLAAIVVGTMPLWAALFARFSGQRASGFEQAGLWLGFAGLVILNLGGSFRQVHPGALVMLLAPVCWAYGSIRSKHMDTAPGMMGVSAMMLSGGVIMLGLALVTGERLSAMPSGRSLLALGYLAVLGSLVALGAYTFLLRTVRPALATSYAYVNPVIAVAIGVGVGDESVSPSALVALAVIVAGVLLVTTGPVFEPRWRRRKRLTWG